MTNSNFPNPLGWVPPTIDDIAGNHKFVEHCRTVLSGWDGGKIGSILLIGPPGTGKSVGQICFFRQLLGDPSLGYGDDNHLFEFLVNDRKQYAFTRIDGDTIDKDRLIEVVESAKHSSAKHVFMLIDEAGELFQRGHHSLLRTLLTHQGVTVWANAQDFGRKGEVGSEAAARAKEAFIRRFDTDFETQLPSIPELVRHLHRRATEMGIGIDAAETLTHLATSVGCVPAHAVRCFGRAISRPRPWKLTRELVEGYLSSRLFD